MNVVAYKPTSPVIRLCTPDDVDWMIEVGNAHYQGAFDVPATKAWLVERMKDSRLLFLRGQKALGVAHITARFHAPSRVQGYLTLIYADPLQPSLEPYRIVKEMVDWAKSKGATKFWLSDITGHDLGAFAIRLGGRLAGHTYVIDLDDNRSPYG